LQLTAAAGRIVGINHTHAPTRTHAAPSMTAKTKPKSRAKTQSKPKTIDEYLAALGDAQRAALQNLRRTIQAAAPQAEEGISYGLAAFRLNGSPLVAFGASTRHWAFYPMHSNPVAAH